MNILPGYGTTTAGLIRYMCIRGAQQNEQYAQMPAPWQGYLTSISANIWQNSHNGQTVFTARINEADTTLTFTVPPGQTGLFWATTTPLTAIPFIAGARLSLKTNATASTIGQTATLTAVEITPNP